MRRSLLLCLAVSCLSTATAEAQQRPEVYLSLWLSPVPFRQDTHSHATIGWSYSWDLPFGNNAEVNISIDGTDGFWYYELWASSSGSVNDYYVTDYNVWYTGQAYIWWSDCPLTWEDPCWNVDDEIAELPVVPCYEECLQARVTDPPSTGYHERVTAPWRRQTRGLELVPA